jgi:hypothetical protein
MPVRDGSASCFFCFLALTHLRAGKNAHFGIICVHCQTLSLRASLAGQESVSVRAPLGDLLLEQPRKRSWNTARIPHLHHAGDRGCTCLDDRLTLPALINGCTDRPVIRACFNRAWHDLSRVISFWFGEEIHVATNSMSSDAAWNQE